jgi:hypothetical protein
MTNPAIIEAATQAMPSFWTENDKKWLVRDILAAVTPLIRAAALEEAAEAEDAYARQACDETAALIGVLVDALTAAEAAILDCHEWRSHNHHSALETVRAALARAAP